MFDRHREPWLGVELGGYCLALAGGRMSNLSGKPTKHHPKVVFLFVDGPGRNRLGPRNPNLASKSIFFIIVAE